MMTILAAMLCLLAIAGFNLGAMTVAAKDHDYEDVVIATIIVCVMMFFAFAMDLWAHAIS